MSWGRWSWGLAPGTQADQPASESMLGTGVELVISLGGVIRGLSGQKEITKGL